VRPRGRGRALVQHPADRQGEDALPVASPSEVVERPDRLQVLGIAGREELRIAGSKVVSSELRVPAHLAGEQPPTQRAVGQRRQVMLFGVGEDIGFDLPLEEVVGRLHHVQRRRRSEHRHLVRREVAHPDRSNLALLEQPTEHPGCLLDGDQWIRPVDLIHVDEPRAARSDRWEGTIARPNRLRDPRPFRGLGGRFDLVTLVEAVGIEPTSGNPLRQASTSIAGYLLLSPPLPPTGWLSGRPAPKSLAPYSRAELGASHRNMTSEPGPR
jgi:hypothetical protein